MSDAEIAGEPGLFEGAPEVPLSPAAAAPAPTPSAVDRAFELARGGGYVTIEQIAAQLKAEQHEAVEAQLFDPPIRRALRQACVEARQSAGRSNSSAY